MAVNTSRSQNADLRLGATDGTFASLTPDRGGDVDMSSVTQRMLVTTEKYNSFKPRSPLAETSDPVLSL